MGTLVSKAFVDVSELPSDAGGFFQILFLGGVYAYILFYGSGLINTGSELLLLVPSVSRLVGSVVNPVLSGVPDAALVLFSGLGTDPRTELGIGMGSLSGSNVFLLTIPWAVAILTGRVRLTSEGDPQYVAPDAWPSGRAFRKLEYPNQLKHTGVKCARSVRNATILMSITALPYIILEIPSIVNGCFLKSHVEENACSTDTWSPLVGAIIAALLFVAYLVIQVVVPPSSDAVNQERVDQLRREAVRDHLITIRGLFPNRFVDADGVVPVVPESRRFQRCLLPFFREFDVNHTGYMNRCDFSLLLSQIGERPTPQQLDILMRAVDLDGKGRVSFMDFSRCVAQIINDPKYLIRTGRVSVISTRSSEISGLSRSRRSVSILSGGGRIRTPHMSNLSTISRGQSSARAAALAKFRAAEVARHVGDDAETELVHDGISDGDLPSTPKAGTPNRSLNEPFGDAPPSPSVVSVGDDDEDDDAEETILEQEHIVHTPNHVPVTPAYIPPEGLHNLGNSFETLPPSPMGIPFEGSASPPRGLNTTLNPSGGGGVGSIAQKFGADQQADHDAHLRSVLASGLTTPTESERSVYSVDPPLEDEFEGDGEEDVAIPESIAQLSPEQQQRRILQSALQQIIAGLVLVFVFSDAIVQVFNELADRIGVKPFYVAFTLAPFISNASVLIASFTYGSRKTEKSVSVAFASLVGSVCVNNTLSIAVFGLLLYFQNLPWTYASETLVILIVQGLSCLMCILFRVHTWWFALVLIATFPACVGLVAAFQAMGMQ